MILVLLDAVLTVAAGAGLVGLVRMPMRLAERLGIGLVLGIIAGAYAVIPIATAFGLNQATVLAGPALVAAAALGLGLWWGDLIRPWRDSWTSARGSLRRQRSAGGIAMFAVAAVFFVLIFRYALFDRNGDLMAGYGTVWADWSQHLTTANSFALGRNLPPVNPLLSGTPLLYPFLPDFHSATLIVLGASPAAALVWPSATLCGLVSLLMVTLARRLGASTPAATIAVVICFLGGGVGFVGAFHDACVDGGRSPSQCTVTTMVQSPSRGIATATATLARLPFLVGRQPRSYDGLLEPPQRQAFSNQQWYTPLLAWWLPQRPLVYGMAVVLSVLVLIIGAVGSAAPAWPAFAVAGLVTGLLPLIHVHSLVALAIVVPALMWRYRRREWVSFLVCAAVLAVPRLLQLAAGPHGTLDAGNQYPFLEPGWRTSGTVDFGRLDVTAANLLVAIWRAAGLYGTGGFWWFWITNLGVAVPLAAVVVIATIASRRRWGWLGAVGARICGAFPHELRSLCIMFTPIFVVANLVVFQSWDWDNTKLFAYWYLAASWLIGSLVVFWWRGRWWSRIGSILMVATTVATGGLVTLRALPWTPAELAPGPVPLVTADDRALAQQVAARTAPRAVFLTQGVPGDPLLLLAGRTAVLGYEGWLWSYGVDFGSRREDVATMYRGCAGGSVVCGLGDLLARYRVSYVEVDDRASKVADGWWHGQKAFPVLVRDAHIVVYDTRHR